jgi:urea transport system permease protein
MAAILNESGTLVPPPRVQLQSPTAFLPLWGWAALIGFLLIAAVLVPLLALALPQGSSLHLSQYWVGLSGKILCYAMVALAMDLVWATPAFCRWATACSSLWAAMPWACTLTGR